MTQQAKSTRSINVTEILREQLLRGDFPPNTRLQETALAERMQVSRTPIRESLRVLSKDGLLDYAPNRGYSVRPFSLDDIVAAFRVRSVLEGLGCRLIAERGMSDELQYRLQSVLALGEDLLQSGQLEKGEYEEWRQMNKEFHLAILMETHNELLIRFANASRNIPIVFNGSFKWYTVRAFQRAQDHHQAIFSAMLNQQPDRADFMMQEHVMHAADILKQNYEEHQ
ncbi:MAG: GntR family transcriptional regulator [Pseudomonadales bacterium]|nr:GntR family transcriptional regulator [Pseudomonadales bacterium]